jgi:hypothetical protein
MRALRSGGLTRVQQFHICPESKNLNELNDTNHRNGLATPLASNRQARRVAVLVG